jgi:hypothetical protein
LYSKEFLLQESQPNLSPEIRLPQPVICNTELTSTLLIYLSLGGFTDQDEQPFYYFATGYWIELLMSADTANTKLWESFFRLSKCKQWTGIIEDNDEMWHFSYGHNGRCQLNALLFAV